MKKHLLILGAVFWCFLISQAQDTQQPVVLVSVEGIIKYTSPGISKSKLVRAGAALKPGGSIQLAKGARVVLFCTDRFVSVSQPGKHSLKAVCEGGRAGNGLSFEFELGEYITAGVELAAYAKDKQFDWIKTITDPKTGGDGWAAGGPGSKGSGGSGWGTGGPGSKGSGGSGWGAGGPGSKGSGGSGWGTGGPGSKGSGGSGWGTPGSQIQLILPFGKVVNGSTTFFWSNQGKHRAFQFTLLDESDNKVFEATVQDSFLVVNLNELNLQMGGKYHWQVQTTGGSPVASNKFDIEISSEEKRLRALKKLEDLQVFKDAPNDVALRLTAEAIALEKAEWFYGAYETYAKARKNHPNNLTRMMHTAFFARYGYYPLAEKAARK